jgi:primosomal protein N' (replication factor Y)
VVFLVPEVALTPQTVARLRSRLEAIAPHHRCVVWHSHLSEGERLDGWFALASGEARVVVGARSAVFAPVRNLQLIVVDEEHEPAYKQDETPRYHGRDVAVMRAKLNGALALLGSATPSLESYANAAAGKYQLVALKQRVDARQLPHIDIVDLRIEAAKQRMMPSLSGKLVAAMRDRCERKEQTILFINRRGYSSSMLCTKCGHVEECTHCSIAMTYHRADETLRCHLCGDQRNAPARCPKCGAPEIRWKGLGTQRVEEAVKRVLPRARVERMDTDTMSKKNRFREVLAQFRAGKIDVLVGTQMIGKGLDFPNVTLVGLVDADISMHVPDFRANERTFQLLVQVAGRAGRGDRAGEVIVQTFTPRRRRSSFHATRTTRDSRPPSSSCGTISIIHPTGTSSITCSAARTPKNSSSSRSSGPSWWKKNWPVGSNCAARRRRRLKKSRTSTAGSCGISPIPSRRSSPNWRRCGTTSPGRTGSPRSSTSIP